jgi:hypothetical protein
MRFNDVIFLPFFGLFGGIHPFSVRITSFGLQAIEISWAIVSTSLSCLIREYLSISSYNAITKFNIMNLLIRHHAGFH